MLSVLASVLIGVNSYYRLLGSAPTFQYLKEEGRERGREGKGKGKRKGKGGKRGAPTFLFKFTPLSVLTTVQYGDDAVYNLIYYVTSGNSDR